MVTVRGLPAAMEFQLQTERLRQQLMLASTGRGEFSTTRLRHLANSLVLRVTQAALQGAKGAGFVSSHPTGRWAREALFFLVWSCPQAVAQAQLCDLVAEAAEPP
jgi:alkylation response protein AidB-like acyl-CoA dehydrogenase